jgi:hypothetical protein
MANSKSGATSPTSIKEVFVVKAPLVIDRLSLEKCYKAPAYRKTKPGTNSRNCANFGSVQGCPPRRTTGSLAFGPIEQNLGAPTRPGPPKREPAASDAGPSAFKQMNSTAFCVASRRALTIEVVHRQPGAAGWSVIAEFRHQRRMNFDDITPHQRRCRAGHQSRAILHEREMSHPHD